MHTRNLEQLKSAASTLTEEEKVALVEYLLENLPLNKRQVILNGGNFIRANNVFQIQSSDVVPLVRAVAPWRARKLSASFMNEKEPFNNPQS